MCGIIGFKSKKFLDMKEVQGFLLQSKIRGQHATGIAWVEDKQLKYKIVPDPATDLEIPKIKTKLLIGHCRYSTSSLEYNQPIVYDNMAVVHNGVISQADPKTWEKKYGLKCRGKNDSELILRQMQRDEHPYDLGGSIACIVIDNSGKTPILYWFRNEYRPLYHTYTNKYEPTGHGQFKDLGTKTFILASTKDIFKRMGYDDAELVQCLSTNYTKLNKDIAESWVNNIHVDDLQKHTV